MNPLYSPCVEASGQPAPVICNFTNDLVVTYVVEAVAHLTFVQNRDLADGGLDKQTLHQIGVRNLAMRCNKNLRVQQHGPIYGVLLGGYFEASLLLVDELWDTTFK